jgi:hypothetical protein
MSDDSLQMALKRYQLQCLRVGRGHYRVAELLARGHIVLGSLVVVLSAATATSLFSSLAESDPRMSILQAICSAAVAILASIQTFWKLSERAEAHKAAGAAYGEMRRSIEVLLVQLELGSLGTDEGADKFSAIAESLHGLAATSPHLPSRYYEREREERGGEITGVVFESS